MATEITTCYRHHDRRAGVSCQRCGRPICPSCMVQASVGFHCPECTSNAPSRTYTARTLPPRRPWVTISLIAVNVVVFLLDLASSGATSLLNAVRDGGDLTINGSLLGAGRYQGEVIGVAAGEWYRVFTGGFLHAGWLHLGMNMLVLWVLGSMLEPVLGRARFLALYITSLVAASFAVLLIDPTVPTVGASGAIFGLMGAAAVAQRSTGINIWRSGIGGLILLNLVFTFAVPGISIGGHVGGLVGGVVAGVVVFQIDRLTKSALPALLACAAMTSALFLGCLWAADQYANPILGFLSR